MKSKLISSPRQSRANIKALKQALSQGLVTLEFIKLDGTRRRIICTRDLNRIPLEFHPKNTSEKRKESIDTLSVFDLQINLWRSLKTNSLTEIFC